jgi:predicted histidine transporter YuiF (NhaC family)
MKTLKILLVVLSVILTGCFIGVVVAYNKANNFKKEVVKYKTEIDETKELAAKAAVETKKALATLTLVATELANCKGVDQDSIKDVKYIKGLLKSKWKKYKADNE